MQRSRRTRRAPNGNGLLQNKWARRSNQSNKVFNVAIMSLIMFVLMLMVSSVFFIGWHAPMSYSNKKSNFMTRNSRVKNNPVQSSYDSRKNQEININDSENENASKDDKEKEKENGQVPNLELEAPISRDFEPSPEFDRDGKTKLHLVFSTDCSGYQHWQSYLLFHSALMVRQPGHVTRIASGCDDKQAKEAQEWHDKHVKGVMSDRFGLHLTPKFDSVTNDKGETTGKDYKFFNKPHGLLHWLEHGEGMGVDPSTGKLIDEDIIVILTDPDMILLRPIGADFNNKEDILVAAPNKETFRVEHGKPAAQRYGYGSSWTNLNMTRIAGKDSPVHNLSRSDASNFYPAGPPYVVTGRDMYTIGKKWSEFVPESYADHPHLMAEMYAYSIAAAHLELPHQLIDSHMVSNTGTQEGWDFIKDIPEKDVCKVIEAHTQGKDTSHHMPAVIHYCQRYMVGKRFFGKRKQPHDFFSCGHPLMEVPPEDIAYKYDWKIPPGKKDEIKISPSEAHGQAFMICGIISALNHAGMFFKRHSCSDIHQNTRWDKSLDLVDLF